MTSMVTTRECMSMNNERPSGTPDSFSRAQRRPPNIDVGTSLSASVVNRTSERSLSVSLVGPRSPFSLSRSVSWRSPDGHPYVGEPQSPKPGSPEQIDVMSPTGGLRSSCRRRSTLQPPPIGERTQAWGKYDTVQEILSRPLPPSAVERSTTMSLQGGRWSFHQPITQTYVLSKISRSTPGPGNYGVWGIPDPVVAGKATPFGKIEGGRMSTSPLRPCTHDILRVSKGVPGPGSYHTDHLFGIYARICGALPKPPTTKPIDTERFDEEQYDSDDSEFEQYKTAENERIESPTSAVLDPIFDDGRETNITTIEQRLVMSKAVPLDKLCRLGTTRYSKLRKDATLPKMRKMPGRRSTSAMSYF